MHTLTKLVITACCLLSINTAHAYGSGQSSSSCDKPVFSEFQPAANKYTQSLSEFSMMASANTVPSSVHVTVSYGQAQFDFPAKELDITVQKSGRLEIKGKLDRPIEAGFARISVTAHSKPSCEKTDGFLVRIQ